jgi:hypothetical protein
VNEGGIVSSLIARGIRSRPADGWNARPRGGSALLDGALLDIASWAAGYLGWLPALGLMPPVWRQDPPAAHPDAIMARLAHDVA